jgi:hypothetical protein
MALHHLLVQSVSGPAQITSVPTAQSPNPDLSSGHGWIASKLVFVEFWRWFNSQSAEELRFSESLHALEALLHLTDR